MRSTFFVATILVTFFSMTMLGCFDPISRSKRELLDECQRLHVENNDLHWQIDQLEAKIENYHIRNEIQLESDTIDFKYEILQPVKWLLRPEIVLIVKQYSVSEKGGPEYILEYWHGNNVVEIGHRRTITLPEYELFPYKIN